MTKRAAAIAFAFLAIPSGLLLLILLTPALKDGMTRATVAYAVATWLTFYVLLGTLILAKGEWDSLRRGEKYKAITDLSKLWNSDALIKSRLNVNQLCDRLKDKLLQGDGKTEEYYILRGTADFFEDLGSLVSGKIIGLEDVKKQFGRSILFYYKLYWPWMCEMRKEDSQLYQLFQWLKEECERTSKVV